MTVFLAEGEAVTEQFETGDVGYVPRGAGHYQAIELSEWLAGNPKALLKSNFSVSDDLVRKLPAKKLFIAP